MRNRNTYALKFAALVCSSGPGLSVAQGEAYRFEVTPFASYRFGGQFEEADGIREFDLNDSRAQGIVLNVTARSSGQWEVLYARQDTDVEGPAALPGTPNIDVDVEHLHFGGAFLFEGESASPFIAMTVGVSRFDPRPGEFSAENYWSVSLGGGLQLRRSRRVGVRLEGRVFVTQIDGGSDIFCESSSGGGFCTIQIDGTSLTQWELRAGLVFRF